MKLQAEAQKRHIRPSLYGRQHDMLFDLRSVDTVNDGVIQWQKSCNFAVIEFWRIFNSAI